MMSPERRELIFKVMEGQPKALPFLHFFDGFRRCDEMLKWLIDNRLTGKNFLDWLEVNYKHSMLEPARQILRNMNRDKERAVLLGRDMLPK